MIEALAAAQAANSRADNAGGALDSALALPGHAYRLLANMSQNLEPFRQYLNQMHPSMLEEAERMGLVPGHGPVTQEQIEAAGFWDSEDEEEDEAPEGDVGSEESSELGRDELDLNDDEDEDESDEEVSDWEEEDDDEDEEGPLQISLTGHM
jgi:hypothetical protein